MQSDRSDEQRRNADTPIVVSFDPDSNVTVRSFAHPEKHFRASTRTDAGMTIDGSDKQPENAYWPTVESRECA
jgi:hypothetical protein